MRSESLRFGGCQGHANWQNYVCLPMAHPVGHIPKARAGESVPRELLQRHAKHTAIGDSFGISLAIDGLQNVWDVGCTCSIASVEGFQLHNSLKAESMPIMRCADMRGNLRRRAYQRAVSVPTPALEQLWASYERFEQSGSNKSLGRQASSSLTC